jgi:hypothetical protein
VRKRSKLIRKIIHRSCQGAQNRSCNANQARLGQLHLGSVGLAKQPQQNLDVARTRVRLQTHQQPLDERQSQTYDVFRSLYLYAGVASELAEVRAAVDCQAEAMGSLQRLEKVLQWTRA